MVDSIEEPVDALEFCCPRCEQPHSDDYEVLCPDAKVEWQCSHCHLPFSVLLTECAHCASVTVEVALSLAELSGRAAQAPCPDCGKPPLRHEEDESIFSGL